MKVSIITCTIRDQFMDNVFTNYEQQQWNEKELIIILNKDDLVLSKWQKEAEKYPNVRVFQLHEGATLGDCLNFGILKANYDYIAKFDDDDYYGPNYLSNSMRVFENDEIFILGKSSYYVYFTNKKALMLIQNKENSYDDTVSGATLIFRKEVYNKVQFQKRTRAEDYFFIEDCKKNGYFKSVLPNYNEPPIKSNIQKTKLETEKNSEKKSLDLKEVYKTMLKNTLQKYQNPDYTK
ncbi:MULTISPECIES: glycosyltransferase [Bacillaceae]|uniref:glycosyltransferase n=1 Tax=Bacillaceae TaxID=186817 RepID=UPI000BFD3426|nr:MULTISPECIES: glycosyltransferase family 2 protein [Bacillaceae]PGT87731.1 glycosyl transferase family 2 [Bacillus sp. AFS040349]UGB32163.1 glycosyltransferase family 2 protein [Metabacillus sp. B2-18]